MRCEEARSMIQDFLDGALEPGQVRAFWAHVEGCPACASEVEGYRSLVQLLAAERLEEIPVGFAEPVVRFLRATGRVRERAAPKAGVWVRVWGTFRIPAVAAAVLIALLSAVSIASGRFVDLVGKGTVAATEAYVEVRRAISKTDVLDGVSRGIAQNVRAAKTVTGAVCLLLSAAGQSYAAPAALLVLLLAAGAVWYVRISLRRSTRDASYGF